MHVYSLSGQPDLSYFKCVTASLVLKWPWAIDKSTHESRKPTLLSSQQRARVKSLPMRPCIMDGDPCCCYIELEERDWEFDRWGGGGASREDDDERTRPTLPNNCPPVVGATTSRGLCATGGRGGG